MIRKTVLVSSFVLLVLFQSCNMSSSKEDIGSSSFEVENQVNSPSFMEVISSIPDIKLPYIMYCGIDDRYTWIEDFDEDFMKTKSESGVHPSIIVGKLPINNDKIYLLYGLIGDIVYPYLNIYDKNGHKLDSLYLHISYCAGDCEGVVSTATTINKDFSIQMADTAKHFQCNENDEGYDRILDSVIVSTRKMNLTKDGFYKITKETRENVK